MKKYILQEKVPSRSDFKWTFSRNCEGTEQLRITVSGSSKSEKQTGTKKSGRSILIYNRQAVFHNLYLFFCEILFSGCFRIETGWAIPSLYISLLTNASPPFFPEISDFVFRKL
ncbi:MAG: hypothetical protein LIO99_10335 [Clostridiales bacterium]|nr:hypothetical protein [Clostridiales bacterium]